MEELTTCIIFKLYRLDGQNLSSSNVVENSVGVFINGRCIYCFGKARGFTVRLGSSKVRQRLRGFSFANSDDSWHLNGGKAKFSNNQEGVC